MRTNALLGGELVGPHSALTVAKLRIEGEQCYVYYVLLRMPRLGSTESSTLKCLTAVRAFSMRQAYTPTAPPGAIRAGLLLDRVVSGNRQISICRAPWHGAHLRRNLQALN